MKITIIIGVAAFLLGGGAALSLTKAIKPEVKVTCPQQICKCPEQKPCNGIDFDKIKSRAITIQNTQYLTVSGDTTLLDAYAALLRKELAAVKLARCK